MCVAYVGQLCTVLERTNTMGWQSVLLFKKGRVGFVQMIFLGNVIAKTLSDLGAKMPGLK